MRFETVSISVGVDSNYPLARRYEYVIYAPNDGPILARASGFKSKAGARRAGVKAANPFLIDPD